MKFRFASIVLSTAVPACFNALMIDRDPLKLEDAGVRPKSEANLTDQKRIRYYGTTDNVYEVEQMSMALENLRGENVHVASVIGGMSSLSLLAQLKHKASISVTFFDQVHSASNLAKLYLYLIDITPTRHQFLERFFCRRISSDSVFLRSGHVSADSMRNMFFERPCDWALGGSVVRLLQDRSASVAEFYRTEFLEDVGCARGFIFQSRPFPKAWPSWDGMTTSMGIGFGTMLTQDMTKKASTLWYGQAGWLKNDTRYDDTRAVVRRATFKLVTASLNAGDLRFMLPSRPLAPSTEVVIFVSNALKQKNWVRDGKLQNPDGSRVFGERLKTAFAHGTVIETNAFGTACPTFTPKCLTMGTWKF